MKTSLPSVVRGIVPVVYHDVRESLGLHPHTDMSRSNVCHHLSLGFLNSLTMQGLPGRREQHETNDGEWHYLIAHAPMDTEPLEADIITDLNPWQFDGSASTLKPLHGERREVQDILSAAGAPDWFVSLRGVSTITRAHTLAANPYIANR